jgi:hypothetical protein
MRRGGAWPVPNVDDDGVEGVYRLAASGGVLLYVGERIVVIGVGGELGRRSPDENPHNRVAQVVEGYRPRRAQALAPQ